MVPSEMLGISPFIIMIYIILCIKCVSINCVGCSVLFLRLKFSHLWPIGATHAFEVEF